MSDEPSGPLTLNLGIVSAGNGQDVLSLDIRYPVTADKEQICSGLREAAAPYQVIVTEAGHVEPLYIPKDTPLVSTLMASYEAAAKKPCTLYSTGGGTYARHCNNTVTGFGPIFPEQPDATMNLSIWNTSGSTAGSAWKHCTGCLPAKRGSEPLPRTWLITAKKLRI